MHLLQIEQILQFSVVVICDNQYHDFFRPYQKLYTLKFMVPGLRGPAGGACKSADTTGWGLSNIWLHSRILNDENFVKSIAMQF